MCRAWLTTSTSSSSLAKWVNDSSDVGKFYAMAKAAKEALDAGTLQVLTDEGYYSSLELKACGGSDITASVPVPEGNGRLEKQGRFSQDFSYEEAADAYHCPAGHRAASRPRR